VPVPSSSRQAKLSSISKARQLDSSPKGEGRMKQNRRKAVAARLRNDLAAAAREEANIPRPQPVVICDYLPPWREGVKRILGLPYEGRGGRLHPGKSLPD
jgi:hypothetical protein